MKVSQYTNRILAVAFAIAIMLPLIAQRFPALDVAVELTENRTPTPRPVLSDTSLAKFPEAFEKYCNDNFGFRDFMIQLDNLAKYKLFNISGTKKVIAGRDGWLFYAANTPGAGTPAENHAGILNDDSNRIFTHIKQRLEETQKYFADEGIRYLFVVAPDKWSIYPEYLPAAHDAKGNDPIALQLVQYLRENSSVEVLDLREALLAAKGQTWPVYRQGDTHWSDLGAFHGSAEILKTVAPHYPVMKPLSLDQYALSEIQTDALDLVNMMGLKGLLKEKTVQLTPQQSPGPQIITTDKPGMHPVYTQQNNRALPSALILRDSYANAMIPFLSTGFSRAQYIWTTNTRGHGLEFKAGQDRPDIIIEMKVERYAMHLHKYFQARIQQTQ